MNNSILQAFQDMFSRPMNESEWTQQLLREGRAELAESERKATSAVDTRQPKPAGPATSRAHKPATAPPRPAQRTPAPKPTKTRPTKTVSYERGEQLRELAEQMSRRKKKKR
jgi:hypothetical protein